jgi:hypothetical protein
MARRSVVFGIEFREKKGLEFVRHTVTKVLWRRHRGQECRKAVPGLRHPRYCDLRSRISRAANSALRLRFTAH